MNDLLKELLDENILKEILLAIAFFISSIIFAINIDKMDKEYQKKYIMILYLLFLMFFIFFGTDPQTIDNSIPIFLFIAFLLNIICGINYGYKSDNLSKFLGRRRLVLYKSLEWFFLTKSYIIYIFIITLKLISYAFIRKNISLEVIYYFLFFAFFIYHLLSNMIDTFGVYSFNYLSKSFFEAREFLQNYKPSENEKVDLISILSFLVFVEDKDFFDRKGAVFNPYYIFRRKLNNIKGNYIKTEIKSRKRFKIRVRYYISITKYILKLISVVFKNIKIYIRGFSTIEQQLVRVLIMYPDTFEKYTFRRKIFVEWVVNPMFFKAFRTRRKVARSRKRIDYNQYKVEFLLFYYKEILGMPKTMEFLITKLYYSSRLNYESLTNLLKKYHSSKLKIKYNEIIKKELEELEINI